MPQSVRAVVLIELQTLQQAHFAHTAEKRLLCGIFIQCCAEHVLELSSAVSHFVLTFLVSFTFLLRLTKCRRSSRDNSLVVGGNLTASDADR